MSDAQRRKAAKKFATYWQDKGYEKGESQPFWLSLLRDVFGVENPEAYISFEVQVKSDKTNFIDGRIAATQVLIEQKGKNKDLRKPIKQSDETTKTPFQQAKRYSADLPHSQHPRWIVVCNFQEFLVYDMETQTGEPERIYLKDLSTEYYRLQFLVDKTNENVRKETEVSLQAGELVGRLYDEFLKEYKDPTNPQSLHSLNVLCVRLVFCLYAEDAGVFGTRAQFHDYLKSFAVKDVRDALIKLFQVLAQTPKERDPYLNDQLAAFPYVNGGLFTNDKIEIPQFNEKIVQLLLNDASENFDWSAISPTIFGAVFESTLNPETRRAGGMHYTSIENIHKVVDPLFLGALNDELSEILTLKQTKPRNVRLETFQKKLAGLTFFDPACGSGNFLTETYISLRRLENKALRKTWKGKKTVFKNLDDVVQVSIGQFFGIEINDFAVTVAKTALWIAESQMLKETEDILQIELDFLPLKRYANIVEGNALRIDWNGVVPKKKTSYIIGNPPFVGYSNQTQEQKNDVLNVYVDEKGKAYKTAGKIDYVAGWYFKAAEYMNGVSARAAFVSTNSITQGEQVAAVWKPLRERFGVRIDFARRTFRWDSEASDKARVHCVIIGFSVAPNDAPKRIFNGKETEIVENINAYLVDGPDVLVESRPHTLEDVPPMINGNKPVDGGHLIIEEKDYDDFIRREPGAQKYIKNLLGGAEFINGKKRYCLWLVGVEPSQIKKLPLVMKRIAKCRETREASVDIGARKLAERPTEFRDVNNPDAFLVVPRISSERRKYIPIGFLNGQTIVTDLLQTVPNATLYHFGVLTSSVHMAWTRAVCGRLKSDYRYSKDVVYNNFPWPTPTDAQRLEIERTAQGILDARALFPDSSLADLYDDLVTPPELREAHRRNDAAVEKAFGFPKGATSENAVVAELMKRYSKLVASQ